MTDPKKQNDRQSQNDGQEKRGGYEPATEGYSPSTPERDSLPSAPSTGSGEKD